MDRSCDLLRIWYLEWIVYPAIDDQEVHLPGGQKVAADNPALNSMDKMLQEADITPTNLKKLGEGFQKLGTTVSSIHEVGDVVKNTSDFSAKTKEATAAITSMSYCIYK